ncbi:MAG: endonuclease [Hellea sp.]|nr:endonuclease [Hellea sp.]
MIDFLSYNIQAGIGTARARDYLLRVHRQFMHVKPKTEILEKIARYIRPFDIVCLQEVDLGGARSGFKNQADFLKEKADFPFMAVQRTRRVGGLSIHGNVILSRQIIVHQNSYVLPGTVKGRGLLTALIGHRSQITIANTHLSLGANDQKKQFQFIDNVLSENSRVILAGDFNCTPTSETLREFDDYSELDMVTEDHHHAFPSWKPERAIDHIFVSKSLGPQTCEVGNVLYSDHRPLRLKILAD